MYKNYTIQSYKYDGNMHRMWTKNLLLEEIENYYILYNEDTRVIESDGCERITKEPAILLFSKNDFFNIIIQFKKKGIYYYCNLASPSIMEKNNIKYIDFDLDLRVFPNGKHKVLDRNEYKHNAIRFNYENDLQEVLEKELETLINMVKNKEFPFNKETVEYYKNYIKNNNL